MRYHSQTLTGAASTIHHFQQSTEDEKGTRPLFHLREIYLIRVIYFTDKAADLASQITEYTDLVDGRNGGVEDALREAFEKKIDLAFIGAAGIAVRLIAPYLRDKTSDPAVICMDEAGSFVISLLSGHLGGANDLA
ncbi:MAG: hypothetical protein II133_05605, partial [Lachnospiraceae bacterium]|nr:hypothetical protein [Lachnospiraceae bacterium]